jgi:SAM-dependent methyltransferase
MKAARLTRIPARRISGFADVQEELSDKSSRLRFMMPPIEQLAEVMGRHGVGDGVQVVLYDRFFNMWAARVWWMLRAAGFDAAVLDGGFPKWKLEGRPVATDDGVRLARQFTARPRPELFTDKADVLAALGKDRVSVVCALPDVEARVMDGQNLDLPDQSFDRVFSNFGLIYFKDRVKGFSEIYRVLRPGGRAVVNAWSSPDRFEAFGLLFGAMAQAMPHMPPRPPSPPPPLSLADPNKLAAEMRAGGFERVRVESIVTHWEVPSPEMVRARMEHSAPPMIDMLKRVGPEAAAKARELMLAALRRRFGDGPVKLPCEAHYGIGER